MVALVISLLPFAEQDQPNVSIESSGDEEEPDINQLGVSLLNGALLDYEPNE